jgi:hypothetical protein
LENSIDIFFFFFFTLLLITSLEVIQTVKKDVQFIL